MTAWAVLVVITGALWPRRGGDSVFGVLISYVMFALLLSQVAMMTSVFVLRRRHPEWPRPYRTTAYPLTPLISLTAALAVAAAMTVSQPYEVLGGTLAIGSGNLLWLRYRKPV
jgi:amino acid transporter